MKRSLVLGFGVLASIILSGCASSNFISTKSDFNKMEKKCIKTLDYDNIKKLPIVEQKLYKVLDKKLKEYNINVNDNCKNTANIKYDIIDDDVVLLTLKNRSNIFYTLRFERKAFGQRTTITQYTPDELAFEFNNAVIKMFKENGFIK